MTRILVTGADGLVGSAIKQEQTNNEFIFVGRKDADLTCENDVIRLFDEYEPEWVVHTAAKVGGIGGNIANHGSYFRDNILMNTHIIHHACKRGVKKLMAFSSVCCFDNLPIFNEDSLHIGQPNKNNYAYGYSKRMVDIMVKAYKSQYDVKNYSSIIPNNIFGCNDRYDVNSGHVIPSLIKKIYEAKKEKTPLRVWGDGTPTREFIFSQDLARIILNIIELDEIPERIIISSGKPISIKTVVEKLCKAADFHGEVIWETDKPNGQQDRKCDLTVMNSLSKFEFTDFDLALKKSYDWFVENYGKVRI